MAHQDHDIYVSAPATLTALLGMRALHQPDSVAFAFLADGTTVTHSVTYAGLHHRARQIAGLLRERGIGSEPVLLLYPPGLEYIAAFFGCLYAGAIAVPAYPPHRNRSLDRLLAVVADSRARAVLCTDAVRESIANSFAEAPELQVLQWLATDVLEAASAEPYCDPHVTPDRLAFLQYTSGSTSLPRGVMLSHGNLFHNARQISEGFALGPDSTSVFWLPLYHDMGLIGGVLQPLRIGRTSYLMAPATFLSNPIRWLRAISCYRAAISGGPNFAYDLCVRKVTPDQMADLDLSPWRVAFNGAEPVHAETLKRFAAMFAECGFRTEAFYPCYGLAEATLLVSGGIHDRAPAVVTVVRADLEQNRVRVTANVREDSTSVPPMAPSEIRQLVSCGKALGDQRVCIVHPETLEVCPRDRPGEIWVSGPSIANGYWRRPDESEVTFQAYTDAGDGPFLRTGDLGFLHDGELFITGRLKDLIILRGRNHYPHDIEQTVERSHPALRPACGAAFAVDCDGEDERLVVAHELERSQRTIPAGEVIAAIRRAVAEQHDLMVAAVVLLKPGSIPKTSSGKIQRHACKSGYLAGTLDVVGAWDAAPADDAAGLDDGVSPSKVRPESIQLSGDVIQAWLVDRIARKLRVPPDTLDPREPLARYGLDSLTAVQLSGELEQLLGRTLSPVLVYDHPTIDDLARHLASSAPSSTGIKVAGSVPSRGLPVTQSAATDSIAVIGIGCRFPGADGPESFWRLLSEGVDAITRVPSERWNIDEFYSEDATKPGKMNTRFGGFLRDVARFDRSFFGISPREAERMDPQQRLLLEVVWEAFEDAGQDAERLAGRPVGVFVGISSSDYGRLQGSDPSAIDAYVGTGNALSIAANRLSYVFDFRGPSLAVDTGCSSSLVAIHLACQSLRHNESELAVAAGVNLILAPELTLNFSRAGMMAPDGRCKAFDAAANGYVRSEGVGVVLLKPLSKAMADGDPVYAVVRGGAVNQDGRSNGLTAPNRQSQEAVLRAAYGDAGIAPADVDLIEAHGTGTALGDPIEVLALGSVLSEGRPSGQLALLGSVKTNIGHLEAAAGVAGFIKAALALKYRKIPLSLHFRTPNPHIPFAELPLRVVTATQPWPERGRPSRAGVSSFGFGGTNAHVVLEEFTSVPAPAVPDPGPHLVPLSARSQEALRECVTSWADFLEDRPNTGLANLAFTAALRRTHHDHRIAVAARTARELAEHFRAWLDGSPRAGTSSGRRLPNYRPRIAFLFSGQGPQWWGMGRKLLRQESVFRDAVEQCDSIFSSIAQWSLTAELISQNDPKKLENTACVQPLLFALQVGLARLWQSWGIVPQAVVGHSLGEVTAAHIAGSLSLNDAVKVVYHRGRLQQRASGQGKMVAVGLSAEDSVATLRAFEGRIELAAINGPRSTVWSGEPSALDEAIQPLREQNVFHRILRGRVAFHSAQMEPLREEFMAALAYLKPQPSAIPIYSTVTGQMVAGESLDAAYWGRNLREPVQFAAAADALLAHGYDTFLEIGPHPVLAEPLGQCQQQRGKPVSVLTSMRRGEDERQGLLSVLGALYTQGVAVSWQNLHPVGGRVVSLPKYAWQREFCWHEAAQRPIESNTYQTNGQTNGHSNGSAIDRHRSRFGEPATPMAPTDKWLVRLTWEPIARPPLAPRLAGTWLLLTDEPSMAARLRASLCECGAKVVIISSGANGFDLHEPSHWHRLVREAALSADLSGVIHLTALSAPPPDALTTDALAVAQDSATIGLLHIIQALAANRVTPRVWVVTRGAQAVEVGEAASVAQAPLWGLGRVLVNEHSDLRVTLVDLDPTPGAGDLPALVSVLGLDPDESQLAWRGEALWAARLERASSTVPAAAPALRDDATYLITGGLGALGLQTASWFATHGARSLVLTGRSGPGASVQSILDGLRANGVNVVVAPADVADPAQLAGVFALIDQTLPPLRGVIHAAGVLDDGIALQLDRARFWRVLAPKVLGAWNIHALTATRKLDFLVLFSSAGALLGSPGQANYAAGNAFLDALATFRRARNLPAVSVNWGPWAVAGMAARDGRGDLFAHTGVGFIDPAAGLELMGRLLTAPLAHVGVMPVDWSVWRQSQGGHLSSLLVNIAGGGASSGLPSVKAASALNRDALRGVPPDDWQPILESQLREQAARVLRLPAEGLDVSQPLNNVGIDSLMAIELKNRIEADLGVTVPMVKFLEGPSVRELAEFLSDQLVSLLGSLLSARQGKDTDAPKNGTAHDAQVAGHLLAQLETLSDEQVDALLRELYAADKGE